MTLLAKLIGAWGIVPDTFALALLGMCALLYLTQRRRAVLPARTFLLCAGAAAAGLSALYAHVYLANTPKIIDATTYALQASWLARGTLGLPVGELSESLRGRFLVEHSDTLYGIFPPGYPVLLAVGYVLGAPMVVGPALAAALVWLTYLVARDIASATEQEARCAALLSVACGALRYHTADTMSHAAAALWLCIFVLALHKRGGAFAVVAGGALACLLATRFASALPAAAYATYRLGFRTERTRALPFLVGAAGPVALLVWYMERTTGAFRTPQALYYSLADTPQGCFAYGLSKHAGCLFEHGDFVRANFPDGYGLWPALKTTGRRLFMHLGDATNGGPLLALGVFGARYAWMQTRPLIALIALQVLAYAPFYFDGNYPGGGARLFADVLPLEHVVLALGFARLHQAALWSERARTYLRSAWTVAPALSALSFVFHASFDHRQLQDRAESIRVPQTSGVIFAATDDAFNLGRAGGSGTWLRLREDAFDSDAWHALGTPPAFVFRDNTLVPYLPQERERYEAESFWPAVRVRGNSAIPVWIEGASHGRALYFRGESSVVLAERSKVSPQTLRMRASKDARGEISWGAVAWTIAGTGVWEEVKSGWSDKTAQIIAVRLEQGELWLDCFDKR